MKKYTIYTLSCPYTNQVRYVGMTSTKLSSRLSKHICDRRVNKRTDWIKSIGTKPIIEALDQSDNINDAKKIESFYISYLLMIGANLVNTKIDDGITKSMRDKISNGHKGKKLSDDTKKKISYLNKMGIIGHYAGMSKDEADRLRELNRIKNESIKPRRFYYKKIRQYSLTGDFIREYESITSCVKINGFSTKKNIIDCCKNKIRKDGSKCKTAYGFRWSYA